MTGSSHLFLLTVDRRAERTRVDEFGGDLEAALAAYRHAEQHVAGAVEVVLLGSDSLESLEGTHSSYFGTGDRTHRVLTAARAAG